MIVRKTTIEDLQDVLALYEKARTFMAQTGNATQWGKNDPSVETVRMDIEQGISHVAIENGEIEAVFVFFQGLDDIYEEEMIEGSWLNEDAYAVIHRIAVKGKTKGIGSKCMQWCISEFPNVKCDTHDDNLIMQHTLEKNGFRRCGRIRIQNGSERIAYHRIP